MHDGPAHLADGVARPPARLAVLGLICWIGLCALAAGRHAMFSWHYFATGGQVLLAPGGLHVYGEHPELQFGPLTMGVCALLGLAPATAAAATACALMVGLGVGVAAILADLSRDRHRARITARTAMVYAALLAPLWLVLAIRYGHLDDALALFFMAGAVALGKRDRWLTAGLLLAAATGAKPWVLPMAVMLLAAPRSARWKAAAIFLVGVVAPWIPFVLADSRTVQLSRFVITIADDSVLRQIGSLALATPTWDRPAQFLLGAALSVWLVRRRRWVCVPFAVLSARLLLDPQTYLYYSTGLALAAAIADLTRRDRRPILTGLAVGWSAIAMALTTAGQMTGAGTVRLIGLLAGLVVIIVDDGWAPPVRRTVLRDVVRRTDPPVAAERPTRLAIAPEPVPPDPDPVVGATTTTTAAVPPRLGRLWSETRKPIRPKTSSLAVRR